MVMVMEMGHRFSRLSNKFLTYLSLLFQGIKHIHSHGIVHRDVRMIH